jgi:nitrite reductase (cytochrome c-552)
MPYTTAGVFKVSDHRVMSPVQGEMKACKQCHASSTEWLKERVFAIQDHTVSLMLRSGYQCATVAKLFEITHNAQKEGKTIDQQFYDKAKEFYEEAFYRSLFMGAENSIGFHNPTEGLRILGDSVAFGSRAEAYLRQALTSAGVDVPMVVNLEILKYVDQRGEQALRFRPELEIPDPSGIQDRFF